MGTRSLGSDWLQLFFRHRVAVYWVGQVGFSHAESADGTKDKVRRHLLQFGAFLLLLVWLCGHVAETFDFWDHTVQTGNDIESLLSG